MLPLTELGQGRQGQPNGGGSEMGKQPSCWDGESKGLPLQLEMLLPIFERYLHQLWRDGLIPFKAAKQK